MLAGQDASHVWASAQSWTSGGCIYLKCCTELQSAVSPAPVWSENQKVTLWCFLCSTFIPIQTTVLDIGENTALKKWRLALCLWNNFCTHELAGSLWGGFDTLNFPVQGKTISGSEEQLWKVAKKIFPTWWQFFSVFSNLSLIWWPSILILKYSSSNCTCISADLVSLFNICIREKKKQSFSKHVGSFSS